MVGFQHFKKPPIWQLGSFRPNLDRDIAPKLATIRFIQTTRRPLGGSASTG